MLFRSLEPLLQDNTISDILVTGPKLVYVERGGKLQRTPVEFKDNAHLLRISASACDTRVEKILRERGLPRKRPEAVAGYSSPACYAGEFPEYFGGTREDKN